MALRLAAALLLALQLNQWVVPAVCASGLQRRSACHEERSGDSPQLTVVSTPHALPCVDSIRCGTGATGIPETSAFFPLPAARTVAAPHAATLEPGEQQPPLPPPPQA